MRLRYHLFNLLRGRPSPVAAAASSIAALGLLAGVSYAQSGPKHPIPFPQNYNYPLGAGDLERKVQQRDTSYLRRHAWYLWAGINQPGRDHWPLWASWPIATQVFAPLPTVTQTRAEEAPGASKSLAAFNAVHQASKSIANPFYEVPAPLAKKYGIPPGTLSANFKDGDTFQNNGDIMLVSEAYDESAYGWIRSQRLYLTSTLARLLAEHESDIPAMPNVSIVLKHMYWPVAKNGLTALPVADMAAYKTVVPAYVGFEDKSHWPQAVAIDPSGRQVGKTASVTYLHDVLQSAPQPDQPIQPPPLGPITYDNAKVVGLSDFYYKQLSMAEFSALSKRDQLLIDASFYWAHGRMFEDGDYLVSIASHIITKEMPRWTLQTAWWSPDPNAGDFAKDRPTISSAKGPWQHYLMTLDDGIPDADDPKKLPIAYNPYIELAADHAVDTNCRNCHFRASYPNGQYLAKGGPGPLAVIVPDDPIFKGKLRTDFLWTIPDRAVAAPTQ